MTPKSTKISERLMKLYAKYPYKVHRNIRTVIVKECLKCGAPRMHYCITRTGNLLHKPHAYRELHK